MTELVKAFPTGHGVIKIKGSNYEAVSSNHGILTILQEECSGEDNSSYVPPAQVGLYGKKDLTTLRDALTELLDFLVEKRDDTPEPKTATSPN